MADMKKLSASIRWLAASVFRGGAISVGLVVGYLLSPGSFLVGNGEGQTFVSTVQAQSHSRRSPPRPPKIHKPPVIHRPPVAHRPPVRPPTRPPVVQRLQQQRIRTQTLAAKRARSQKQANAGKTSEAKVEALEKISGYTWDQWNEDGKALRAAFETDLAAVQTDYIAKQKALHDVYKSEMAAASSLKGKARATAERKAVRKYNKQWQANAKERGEKRDGIRKAYNSQRKSLKSRYIAARDARDELKKIQVTAVDTKTEPKNDSPTSDTLPDSPLIVTDTSGDGKTTDGEQPKSSETKPEPVPDSPFIITDNTVNEPWTDEATSTTGDKQHESPPDSPFIIVDTATEANGQEPAPAPGDQVPGPEPLVTATDITELKLEPAPLINSPDPVVEISTNSVAATDPQTGTPNINSTPDVPSTPPVDPKHNKLRDFPDLAKDVQGYGALVEAIYDNGSVSGYKPITPPIENPNSGFKARIFLDEGKNEVVVVMQGSDFGGMSAWDGLFQGFGNFLPDWLPTNVAQSSGGIPPQYQQALKLVQSAENWSARNGDLKVKVVGHSLGGGLAAYAGLKTGNKVITYNSAPMGPGVRADALSGDFIPANESVINIRTSGDAVSGLGAIVTPLTGETFILPGKVYSTVANPASVSTIPLVTNLEQHSSTILNEALTLVTGQPTPTITVAPKPAVAAQPGGSSGSGTISSSLGSVTTSSGGVYYK
jgi:hypothetical protein